MIPRSALQQAIARLKAAACPYRFRERRGSPFLTVYETCKGGSTATARNYRADDDAAIEMLTTILLAAQASLRQGGPGLDWQLLSGAPSTPAGLRTPRQTWGEICALITADIAPGGQKARDPNPFVCFRSQGYFAQSFEATSVATTDQLEQFCLYTPASLKAHRRDPREELVPRAYNSSVFYGVIQMVNHLVRRQVAIATPELVSKLDGLKRNAGRRRLPQPRYIPRTADLEAWLDLVIEEDPLRGWVLAMIATFGLRPHEVWHLNHLPGECLDPTHVEVSTHDTTGASCTKTGHRFAQALPESWLARYGLDDIKRSKALLARLRAKHPIQFATAADGSIQCCNNSDLGRVISHWFNHPGHRSSEISHKLFGLHQPRALPGQADRAAEGGRSTPYDLRHAWAIRARETTVWSTALKAQFMGHSEAIHTQAYLSELTAAQKEKGLALLKAHDEGQPHRHPTAPLMTARVPVTAAIPSHRRAERLSKTPLPTC